MHITITKGKDTNPETLENIRQIRSNEFGGWKDFDDHQKMTFVDGTFFIVYDDAQEIMAAGCIKPVSITFLEKEYNVLGIGSIVAVKKGQGYGKVLTTTVAEHIRQTGKTGIGFCTRANTPFYEKCGFQTGKNTIQRFVYKDQNKKANPDNDDDILYIEGQDTFIKTILANPTENIYVPFFW